jgi:hypothetical protein
VFKEVFSFLAIVLTFWGFFPYIRSILREETKPHVFSWIIWGITTLIVFFAQYTERAGTGSFPIGISGIITIYIAFLAYTKRTDSTIYRSDWFFFISAIAALPIWFVTADPLWAVIILTFVDIMGFAPTVRKALAFPHEENITFFGIFAIRNLLVILALENYSIATVLFPAAVGIACLLLIVAIVYRRQIIPKR